jgi:hypothetical protein
MSNSTVDLEFLARQTQKTLDETRTLKKEVADIRTLTLQTIEYGRRVERRLSEMRDDLELIIKTEFGGGFAHMQTTLENSIFQLAERVGSIAERVGHLETKF